MVAVCCGYPQRVRKLTEQEEADKRRDREAFKAFADAFLKALTDFYTRPK